MKKFEVAGDSLYFIGDTNPDGAGESFLKRLSLSHAGQVTPIASRADLVFLGLLATAHTSMPGADRKSCALPLAGGSQPERVLREPGDDITIWAMAQTDSHVYWSTTSSTRAARGTACRAQVSRVPKDGGAPVLVSQAQQPLRRRAWWWSATVSTPAYWAPPPTGRHRAPSHPAVIGRLPARRCGYHNRLG